MILSLIEVISMIQALLKKGGMILFNEKKRKVIIVTKYNILTLSYDTFISQLKGELSLVDSN